MVDLIRLGPHRSPAPKPSDIRIAMGVHLEWTAQSQRVLIPPATRPGPDLSHCPVGVRPNVCSPHRTRKRSCCTVFFLLSATSPCCCHQPRLTLPFSGLRTAPQQPLCPIPGSPLNAPSHLCPSKSNCPSRSCLNIITSRKPSQIPFSLARKICLLGIVRAPEVKATGGARTKPAAC